MKSVALLYSLWHWIAGSSTRWSRGPARYSTCWRYAWGFVVAAYYSIWSAL